MCLVIYPSRENIFYGLVNQQGSSHPSMDRNLIHSEDRGDSPSELTN
jgi:hypothetical protein